MLIREQRHPYPTALTDHNVETLVDCLVACGFDADLYLSDNADLQSAGLDAIGALRHFITHGLVENRAIVCAPIPAGLESLSALLLDDRRYASLLFRSVLFGQLRNAMTADRLWLYADARLLDMIRANDGLPCIVIGDSHAAHYRRTTWVNGKWLAPLALVCRAASATGLLNENSRTGSGKRILNWARGPAQRGGGIDVPVIMKFGGMDAEFTWMTQRLKNRIYAFDIDEFDTFATQSVARYGLFLDLLSDAIDPALLRICATFPAVLGDAHWIAHGIAERGGTEDEKRVTAVELGKMDIPDLHTRTQLRVVYNGHLAAMCAARGLRYIDDFSPLIGPGGVVDNSFIASHRGMDHHLDHEATDAPIVGCLLDALGLLPTGLPFVRWRPS